jgi:hypothetical protein
VQTGPNGNQRPSETCLEKRRTQCKATVGSFNATGTDNCSAEGMELSWPRNFQLQKVQLTALILSRMLKHEIRNRKLINFLN